MKTLTVRRLIVSFFIVFLVIVLSIFLFIASVIYVLNNGNPYTNFLFNKHLPPYLEEKGYSDEDISHQHIVAGMDRKDYYYDNYRVIFKDEPNVSYYYGIKKKGKSIAQFCEKEMKVNNIYTTIITEKTKHSEEDCISKD
ncbi:DUF3139 domain-containing protein [Bacillus testis]|uniref:DUF3139 domain-containing protein n=1 Tax=Bacillus testis TaxID=1622072 RepID=UPI00067F51C4|nr:DUF3139 domain-containing protein [Bacillus testis]